MRIFWDRHEKKFHKVWEKIGGILHEMRFGTENGCSIQRFSGGKGWESGTEKSTENRGNATKKGLTKSPGYGKISHTL